MHLRIALSKCASLKKERIARARCASTFTVRLANICRRVAITARSITNDSTRVPTLAGVPTKALPNAYIEVMREAPRGALGLELAPGAEEPLGATELLGAEP